MEEEKDVLQDTQKPDMENENSEQENEEFELDELLEGEEDNQEDNQPSPEELVEKNKKLFNRAKKAEAEAKALKAKLKAEAEKKLQTNSASQPETQDYEVDKKIFLATGGKEEDWDTIMTIVKAKGVTPQQAQQDDYYKYVLEKREAEGKRKQAQLEASKAGVAAKKQKNLSPEEEKRETMKRAQEILKKNFGG